MAVIFSDGFESGDFSAWTGVNNDSSVQTTIKHKGTYAAKTVGNLSFARKAVDVSEIYTFGQFYITALPVNGVDTFFHFATSGYSDLAYFAIRFDGSKYYYAVWTPVQHWHYTEIATPDTDVWFTVQAYLKTGEGNAVVALYINSVKVVEVTDETITSNVGYVDAGGLYCQDAAFEIYFDAVVFADAYVYPEIQRFTLINEMNY